MFSLPKDSILGELSIVDIFQYFDIPRLFSCKNRSGSHYLALSTFDDYEDYEWLYLPLSIDKLSDLESGNISLRDVFVNPEDGHLYKVCSCFNGKSQVSRVLPEQLKDEDLPAPDVFLKISNPERETCTLLFYPHIKSCELRIKVLGSILKNLQELFDAIGQYCGGSPTLRGAIPKEITSQTEFMAIPIVSGSFGIQLKSKQINELFNDSLAHNVLLELMSLLEFEDKEDRVRKKLHLLKGRVASRYRDFLKDVINSDSPTVNIQWKSPKLEKGKELSLTRYTLEKIVDIVTKADIEMRDAVVFRAELLGLDIKTKRYRVIRLTDSQEYAGKIDDVTINKVAHSEINGIYEVTLKEIIETNTSSGSENEKWLLVDLNEDKEPPDSTHPIQPNGDLWER